MLEAQIGKGIQIFRRDKNNIAAFAAVTAIGTSRRHIFFPAERDRSVSSVSGFDI